jgi:dephospho-CoA kinase
MVLRVGLTGGLASGKSFVGAALAELGCFLVKADDLGHQVLMTGGEAYADVIQEFGREILDPDGTINRRRLGHLVFDQPDRLTRLNELVHPPVRARQNALIEEFAHREPDGIAVVEAAILIETGSHRHFHKMIVAACQEEQQIERAMSRDGASREEVVQRLKRQMPLQEKVRYADYIVDTSGTKEHTLEQTRSIYQALRSTRI